MTPMHEEELQFLLAIVEAPDDDTLRLVYADWLEEKRGDADRAQLIRIQCGHEQGDAEALLSYHPEWERARCYPCVGLRCTRCLGNGDLTWPYSVRFDRGMPSVTCTLNQLGAVPGKLTRWAEEVVEHTRVVEFRMEEFRPDTWSPFGYMWYRGGRMGAPHHAPPHVAGLLSRGTIVADASSSSVMAWNYETEEAAKTDLARAFGLYARRTYAEARGAGARAAGVGTEPGRL